MELNTFLISDLKFFNPQSTVRNLQWSGFLYKYRKSV